MTRRILHRRRLLRDAAAASATSLLPRGAAARPGRDLAADPLRPQVHLLPPSNWMNDPCGPCLHNGTYHLFYQHNPDATVPEHIVWGHAQSPELLSWRHDPVALAPSLPWDRDGVWTGSVVLDDGVPTALYTGVPGEQQCLATADDTLLNWRKAAAPLALARPPGHPLTGFRDPQAWRDGALWRLVLGAGVAGRGGRVLAYHSPDLRRWHYDGVVYEEPDTRDLVCECPDLFALGDAHVLLYSNRGTTHYLVGDLVGTSFKPRSGGRLDFGLFYAAKSLRDAVGDRIVFGWIGEDRSADQQRAAGWAGVMSLPRRLRLLADGTLAVGLAPVVETLPGGRVVSSVDRLDGAFAAPCLRLTATMRGRGSIALVGPGGPFVTISYDAGQKLLACNERTTPFAAGPEGASIDAVVDGSVIELFAGQATCLTVRSYRDPTGPLRLVLDGDIAPLIAHQLSPVSADRLTGGA